MKRMIDDDKIDKIKTFWQLNSKKPLWICDIKAGVWRDNTFVLFWEMNSTVIHGIFAKLIFVKKWEFRLS